MKNRFLITAASLCLGLLLCLSVFAASGLSDIAGHWAEEQIEEWVNKGLISGYPDGQFKPDNPITRAEFVTLVNRACKIPQTDSATSNFSDVKASDWFYKEVLSGQAAGYISGYPDGTFKPNDPISRQETAALIANYLGLQPGNDSIIESFNDYQSIAAWAKPMVNAVVANNIINGFPDKTFGAQKNITRAETVVILDKVQDYCGDAFLGVKGIVKMDDQPVKGALVRIFAKGSNEVLQETVTAEDAEFSFAVPAGEYEITAVQDKNVGYAGITVIKAGSAVNQEIILAAGARVNGTLLDKSGRRLANLPLGFTTNPTFVENTDSQGNFSLVLPMRGSDGQLLTYTGYFIHDGIQGVFARNLQFNGDTNLGQISTEIPGTTPPGGGGGGGGSGDTTPPAWAAGYPKTADPSPDGFRLLFTANENGTAYYVVLADGAAAPSASEVKNGTGNGGAVAIGSGNTALEANTEASVNVSGLNADTSYDIYVVAEDNVGNLQSSPVKLDVKTTSSTPGDTTPPTLISAAVNGSILELTFDEKLDASSQPAGSDFIVSVQSMQVNVSDVSISNNQVIITLAEPVKPGDNVTVSYTPGTNPIRDEAGNNATTFSDLPVTNNAGVLVAPPLDPTVATTIFNSTAFLYTGSNAVQTGMAPDTIEEKRAAVIRGRVLNRDNTPLPEVRITINHPEFGSTLSRSDGYFDMAVNGGGVLTVRYEKDGYITAQRQVDVPWQDFALLPDVVLINYDSTATPVTLGSSTMQVVRGSQITDKDGTNRRR